MIKASMKILLGFIAMCNISLASTENAAAMVGDVVNGQYVYNNGMPIEGVMEKGISISKYQNRTGEIDWNSVKEAGVSFVFVRMGYLNDLDPYFDENMRNAAAHGLKTGAYLYSQATSTEAAIQEAQFFVENLKEYQISYPVALDFESQYILDAKLSVQEMTDIVNAFCKVVADAGYFPLLYGNNKWLTQYVDTSQIPYDIWYSRYYTDQHDFPNRGIWQCIDVGKVDGINGNVLIELAFKDYSPLIPEDTWRLINGKWYYFKNYQKQTGWLNQDNKWYYLNESGIMVTNMIKVIDGITYQFNESGEML